MELTSSPFSLSFPVNTESEAAATTVDGVDLGLCHIPSTALTGWRDRVAPIDGSVHY